MNFSDHYELNLVEGADIVNPLIQDVPNYEKIDEVMYANACGTIGIATELTSGSVHSITRQNPDANMFRFTATSNWTAGDTMTVDGIQVTVLLPTGEALGSGAYVINATVLCSLVGTLVTVYGPSGSVSVAENALKLDGHEASYFATAEAVETAQSTASAAGVLANAANTTAEEAKSIATQSGLVKVWENVNPSVAFTSQAVSIDLSGYDYIEVYYRNTTTSAIYNSCMGLIGHSILMNDIISATATINLGRRTADINADGITFADATRTRVQATSIDTSNDNTYLIPEIIYGGRFTA